MGGVLHQPLLQQAHRGLGSGAGHRVAAIGAPVATHQPFFHQRPRRGDARQRQARSQPLGHDEDVRRQAKVLHGKKLARAAKARLHLVGHQQDAVLVADLAQAGQEGWRRHHVATLAQHRLDDDGGRL